MLYSPVLSVDSRYAFRFLWQAWLVLAIIVPSSSAQLPPPPVAARTGDSPLKLAVRPDVDELLFLVRALESLYDQWPSPAGNRETLKASIGKIRRKAHQSAQYLKEKNLDQTIASLYEDLAVMLDRYEEAVAEIDRISREGAALVEHQRNEDLTGASLNGGFLAGSAYAKGASGREAIAMWAGVTLVDYLVKNAGKAGQVEEAKRAAIAKICRDYETRYSSTVARAQAAAIALTEKYKWASSEAGFNMSLDQSRRILDTMEHGNTADLTRLHDVACRQRPRDPFAIERRAISTAFEGDVVPKVEELIQKSDECIKAAELVPNGLFFDDYRSYFVFSAGLLANVAALAEVGNRGWSAGPVRSGPRAVRIWKTYLALTEANPSGEARAQLAWAMAYSGLFREALEIASEREVIKLKFNDPVYIYNLARLYALNGRIDDSHAILHYAIKTCGVNDINHVRSDPDLLRVRQQFAKSFADLTSVKFECSMIWGIFSDDICLVNKSHFALTNVNFKFTVSSEGSSDWTQKFTVDRIEPGQTYRWNTRIGLRGSKVEGVGVLRTDQTQ